MFLKRFIFINWGNIPTLDFEFGPINLFSGGNGSGKTTAADAIQTIMTAAHENLFQYNPGQDETTQRGRGGKRVRTLASYVLGCDDGSYARLEPSDGYLAAVFHPNNDEAAEPFTALIAVRAWLERAGSHAVAREDVAQFYVLPGVELTQQQLVDEAAGSRQVLPVTELQTRLVQALGKRRVERYDGKKAYLRRLYGALRGKPESVSDMEAVAAARAFSRFMAYKPVKSIDRFVADEILEQRDLGEAIRSVSSQLKTIHGMERDAAQLVESIDTLARAEGHAQTYIAHWIDLNLLDYTLAKAEFELRQQDFLHGREQQRDGRRALQDTDNAIVVAGDEARSVQQQLITVEAQRQGISALQKKDELEQQGRVLDTALRDAVRRVLDEDQAITANIQATREIGRLLATPGIGDALPQLAGLQTQASVRAVEASAKSVLANIHDLVQRDAVGTVSAIEQRQDALREVQSAHNQWYALWHDRSAGGQRDPLAELAHARKARYGSLGAQRVDKQREIARLDANEVSYPGYVERALNAIRQQCPAADPRVLCDHVEVRDPRWQSAIEGYIGSARYAILVTEDFESEAIRIVRRLPGRDNRARVIQGAKAAEDAARVRLDEDSIIHVLEFSHAVARAYLVASYGTVLRVDSAEQLRRTRRGVTEDGMGSGNYAMWRCDVPDSELVFGAAARERALRAKRDELAVLEQEWHQANDQMQQSESLLRSVDSLRQSEYGDALQEVASIQRRIDETAALLGQLDLSEHRDLEDRLQQLQRRIDELDARKAELNSRKGRLQTELEGIEQQIKALGALQERNREKVETHEAALQGIAAVWPDFDVGARLDGADGEAKTLQVESATAQRAETERLLHAAERRTAEEIQAHNQRCRPSDQVAYAPFSGDYGPDLFASICAVSRELDRVHNILKNNILVDKHRALAELKAAFNNAFVSHLCHAIYQALGEGRRQIDLLNRELQHHQFGADRETFRFAGEWVPEYRDYSRFFEDVVKTPGLGDEVNLFDAALSERSDRVREELMALLLDEDEGKAMRDLARIADYRNYRRYEIYKEVEGKEPIPLSEYGTGSGGQLETPAYIIRSAAITSAFRFAEGGVHLRMVLVDEAFSKMDETRSREVIRYLSESLGLQLLFIMPTSKCGPYMDLISNEFVFAKVPSVTRRGELNTRVLVDRKQVNEARVRELWESHRRSVYQQAAFDFMEEFAAQ
ncbi:MAG: AAA family ATPase [Gammaproteobacteria bacterium]|nr:AAA family ATPase [Gammaproteobacteria bacterium]